MVVQPVVLERRCRPCRKFAAPSFASAQELAALRRREKRRPAGSTQDRTAGSSSEARRILKPSTKNSAYELILTGFASRSHRSAGQANRKTASPFTHLG